MCGSRAEIIIRRLLPDDAARYVALRVEALSTAPKAFAASPEDDRGADVAKMAESLSQGLEHGGSVIFGGFRDEQLVGVVGLYREPYAKMVHKAGIWGMYLQSSVRGQGLGDRLMTAAIDHARQLGFTQIGLGVGTYNKPAIVLYERHGFCTWGTEVRAMLVDGEYVDEHHMVLNLKS